MKTKLFFTALFYLFITNIYAQFSDNMESYVDGQPIYQDHWEDWGCGGSCPITSSSVYAQGGVLSGYVSNSGTDGVLNLGNQTTGEWGLSFWMYIPSGNEGYFNLQGQVPTNLGEWIVGDFYFNQDNANPGIGHITDTALGDVFFSFPHDQWFRIVMNFDLTSGIAASTWQFNIDGVDVVPFGTSFTTQSGTYPTALGGVDYFSNSNNTSYWIDTFDFENNYIDPTIQDLTYVPDDNFEQALIDLGYDVVLDNYVLTANIDGVTNLNLNDKNITDLTGIEDFISLVEFHCSNNQLSSLDVSQNILLETFSCNQNNLSEINLSSNNLLSYFSCAQNNISQLNVNNNTQLNYLNCYGNSLSTLNLSQNTNLEYISCIVNQIVNLDLSANTLLTEIYIQDNQLESLNVKNGTNNSVTNFLAFNNPNLECIEVDDFVSANMNTGVYSSWVVDAIVTYSEDCSNQTFVPDNNFEQELIALGYDRVLNDYVPTANISNVTFLNVSEKNISNLTGIEDFSSLQILYATDNQLTELDLSGNVLLTHLGLTYNQIGSIDISQNINLVELGVQYNQISSVDLSQNINLTGVYISNNQLANLDLSQNSLITDLWIGSNQLTSLNFENNIELKNVGISFNNISEINLSQNIELIGFQCIDNLLTTLDVTQNVNLMFLEVQNNQLESLNLKNGNTNNISFMTSFDNPNLDCIQVDADIVDNIPEDWNYDAGVSFSDDCEYLAVLDNELNNLSIYPNPTNDRIFVTIGNNTTIQSLQLYSISGKLLLETKAEEIDLSNLSVGMYLLKIQTDKGLSVKKVIKK